MGANRRSAVMVGVLFLIATAAYISGNVLIESIMSAPDDLKDVYSKKDQVILGVLLELINCFAVVGIAIVLFPILKQHNEKIALGYIGFRVIEAMLLIVGTIGPLLQIRLSQEYIQAGAPAHSYFHTIGALAAEGSFLAFQLAMIVLGLYSLVFCTLLYRTKLIPRFLTVLGLVGYASLSASAIVELMGYNGMVLYAPGALFEIMMPLWLIVKGFNASKIRT
ncbi:hypothetical protein YDYSG_05440 [Paenibacillus tyrfis]|uniref:DUF4386 domain-containing protein n=1 Tax=Paenibacillus TaxID=44249 RepID=UPI0024930FA1|nr:DUF4386 domain-containing protein [Paenibacillus tyrfis]GLI04514.1 hypothetical protein YDYSG_05440 [Paenibacillus tyrfis]GMX65322.1 hypothetical protein Elgi_45920 [Paenibacillus elgii]